MNNRSFWSFARYFHPLFLLGGALLYSLGAGIARYLGYTTDWSAYILGQICTLCLQLLLVFLPSYFETFSHRPFSEKLNGLNNFSLDPALDESDAFSQKALFSLNFGFILVIIASSVLLIKLGHFTFTLSLLLLVAFLLIGLYANPRLRFGGYGALIQAVLMANLLPTFAFFVQTGSLHRLLLFETFPITFIYLAMLVASELPHYPGALKEERPAITGLIGWQNAIRLHNLLILGAFMLVSVTALFGLPWQLIWPAFLALPFGLLEIWFLMRITEGVPPRWQVSTYLSAVIFILMTYMISFSLWIH